MSLLTQIRVFLRRLRDPQAVPRHEPTAEQQEEITEEIRKQRFYGDLPGRRQYE